LNVEEAELGKARDLPNPAWAEQRGQHRDQVSKADPVRRELAELGE